MNTFIVELWSRIFQTLGHLSLFGMIRMFFPRATTACFVDVWVFCHLLLAFITIVLVALVGQTWYTMILVIYGLMRVFEVSVYQMNVLLFDEYRARKAEKEYAVEGYRRIVLLLLHNYFEIIFWFAATYLFFGNLFSFRVDGSRNTIFGGIYTSFIEMTTFGEPNISPKGILAASLILWQSVVGIFMTLLSLARFISLIPTPKSKDSYEVWYRRRLPKGKNKRP